MVRAVKPAVRSDTWLRITRFIIRTRSQFRSAYLGVIIYVSPSAFSHSTSRSRSLSLPPSLYLYFSLYTSPLPLPRTCFLRLTTTIPFSAPTSLVALVLLYSFLPHLSFHISFSLTGILAPSLQPYFSSRYSARICLFGLPLPGCCGLRGCFGCYRFS